MSGPSTVCGFKIWPGWICNWVAPRYCFIVKSIVWHFGKCAYYSPFSTFSFQVKICQIRNKRGHSCPEGGKYLWATQLLQCELPVLGRRSIKYYNVLTLTVSLYRIVKVKQSCHHHCRLVCSHLLCFVSVFCHCYCVYAVCDWFVCDSMSSCLSYPHCLLNFASY